MGITLCIKCGYHRIPINISGNDTCASSEAPYKDFVDGKKYCRDINTEGNCKFYSTKDEDGSIYESKTDEELARIPDANTD